MVQKNVRLGDLATFVTSKNAGPFLLTVDVVFSDRAIYERVKQMGVVNPRMVSKLYGIPESHVLKVVNFDPASAIKVTFKRPVPSGAVGDTDVYGAQQHVPIMQYEIAWDDGSSEFLVLRSERATRTQNAEPRT